MFIKWILISQKQQSMGVLLLIDLISSRILNSLTKENGWFIYLFSRLPTLRWVHFKKRVAFQTLDANHRTKKVIDFTEKSYLRVPQETLWFWSARAYHYKWPHLSTLPTHLYSLDHSKIFYVLFFYDLMRKIKNFPKMLSSPYVVCIFILNIDMKCMKLQICFEKL